MANITVFGKGNMGSVIGGLFQEAGNEVSYIGSQDGKQALGDIIVLAVPYAAVDGIITNYADDLADKVIVDITNPVNFETFDSLVVPADSSAAQEIQAKANGAKVVKAFNTNFGATLASKKVGEDTTTVLAAGESEAKAALAQALEGSVLNFVDAGELTRARELEAMGFLQITLAAREEITWTAGFAVIK